MGFPIVAFVSLGLRCFWIDCDCLVAWVLGCCVMLFDCLLLIVFDFGV